MELYIILIGEIIYLQYLEYIIICRLFLLYYITSSKAMLPKESYKHDPTDTKTAETFWTDYS